MWLLLLLLLAGPVHAYNQVVGSYAVGASPADNRDISVSPSFAIDALIIKCDATESAVWTNSALSTGSTLLFSSSSNTVANAIQSIGTGTFQVGTAGEVQAPSTTCYYAAFGGDANNDLAVGVYTANTGTCADNCDVTISPTFQVDMVWLRHRTGGAATAVWKSSDMGTSACFFSSTACATDNIQALNANGFQYGASANVNTNGIVYGYVAFKSVPDYNASVTYTGNAADDRTIATIDTPIFVWTKRNSTTGTCLRHGSAGDVSWNTASLASAADQIQALNASGFVVGTQNCVNANGSAYFAWASKQPLYASARPRGAAIWFP